MDGSLVDQEAKGCLHEFDGTGFPDLVAKVGCALEEK